MNHKCLNFDMIFDYTSGYKDTAIYQQDDYSCISFD